MKQDDTTPDHDESTPQPGDETVPDKPNRREARPCGIPRSMMLKILAERGEL
jgi:hypothetical protein